ncbi:uncharacterized protein LOC108162865 [Drosophila miranda]|uniref:uncharacterized protein LOC108162865 n=1 Tax=Drosophila miranda TaxID=7229 RepID=UPI0007E67AED|nr:uncharacterized protein LOC108162865 [Drosophila miranda]
MSAAIGPSFGPEAMAMSVWSWKESRRWTNSPIYHVYRSYRHQWKEPKNSCFHAHLAGDLALSPWGDLCTGWRTRSDWRGSLSTKSVIPWSCIVCRISPTSGPCGHRMRKCCAITRHSRPSCFHICLASGV